jgi:hypothetical protein
MRNHITNWPALHLLADGRPVIAKTGHDFNTRLKRSNRSDMRLKLSAATVLTARLGVAKALAQDAFDGLARAHEFCGRPAEGLAVLEREALALPGLNARQAAEVKFIMAELARAAGDNARAVQLAREAAAAPHIRPALADALETLTRELSAR